MTTPRSVRSWTGPGPKPTPDAVSEDSVHSHCWRRLNQLVVGCQLSVLRRDIWNLMIFGRLVDVGDWVEGVLLLIGAFNFHFEHELVILPPLPIQSSFTQVKFKLPSFSCSPIKRLSHFLVHFCWDLFGEAPIFIPGSNHWITMQNMNAHFFVIDGAYHCLVKRGDIHGCSAYCFHFVTLL